MALIHALLYLTQPYPRDSFRPSVFNVAPYDLGSFDEIAHDQGSRGSGADSFQVGCVAKQLRSDPPSNSEQQIGWDFTFGTKATVPQMISMRVSDQNDTCIDVSMVSNHSGEVIVETQRGRWRLNSESMDRISLRISDINSLKIFPYIAAIFRQYYPSMIEECSTPLNGKSQMSDQEVNRILNLANAASYDSITNIIHHASASFRSGPLRNYDPLDQVRDPEENSVPTYFASLASSKPELWKTVKNELQQFGRISGLFDELTIAHVGNNVIEKFQIQVRMCGSRYKGPLHNIVDVGYGVSQVLPLVAELLTACTPSMFLVQQPEIYLHPKSQAALGSLFCQVANRGKQLVVETHSDYIIDRIRMDIRDQNSNLSAEDVSILYFDHDDLDSKIHCLRIDKYGNILDSPDSYRQFFMKETRRSLGL